jgi:hypothetical protein
MFCALVLKRVGREIDHAEVVAVNEGAYGKRVLMLSGELWEPGRHTIGHGAVLGFGALARNHGMALQRLGDKVVPKEYDISGGGSMCV